MLEQLENEFNDDYNSKYLEYVNNNKLSDEQKIPLIVAVWGILLGVIYGVGIFFSTLSLILLKVKMIKQGTTFKWTLSLGIIGIFLSLLFIIFETLLLIFILRT